MKVKFHRFKQEWNNSSWSLVASLAYFGTGAAYLLIRDKAKEELFRLVAKARRS